MIVSLNETTGLATKAAWGAGRPWGLAQDAGYAVSALEAMHLPGAECLLDLLLATDHIACDRLRPVSTRAEVWTGKDGLCPLLTGAYIADAHQHDLNVKLERVYTPLLLLPFARLAASGCLLKWDETSIIAGKADVSVIGNGVSASTADIVEFTQTSGTDVAAAGITHSSQSGPVDIDDEIWEGLSALAHRTYVPATEASRLKGAGAGLTDND